MIHSCLHRICCCSVAKSYQLFVRPRTVACQAPPSFTKAKSLLKFMSTESVMQSNHLILYHPFSFCLQSFPTSGSLPKIWLFASSHQRASASASFLPMNIQDWFPLGLTGLIFLSSRDSQESSPALQIENTNSLLLRLLYGPQHVILKGKLIPSSVRYLTKWKLLVKIFNTKILPSLEEEAEVEVQRNLQSLHCECLLLAVWTTPLAPFKSSWEMQGFRPHFRTCISESTF